VCYYTFVQLYRAQFEAAVEVLPTGTKTGMEPTQLSFELCGEGCLPTVHVSMPSLTNRMEQPVMLFRRTLIGRYQTLQLVLTNDGPLPAVVLFQILFYI